MYQYSQGKHNKQGHKAIPEGHFEEEQGRKGFFGPVSHLIKPEPSTRWTNIEGPLRPHLFDTVELAKAHGQWKRLLFNGDVAIHNLWLRPDGPETKKAVRNSDGDTLYFAHRGSGVVLTEYGLLHYRPGSYVCLPKALHHTFFPKEETQFLIIESKTSNFREPDRGMVGKNAFYDAEAFGKPNLDEMHAYKKANGVDIRTIEVKRLETVTTFTYAGDVFDTAGWKGDYFPFTLHIDDLMPLMSHRVHLPPSAHTTLVANGFVVCTFLPRPVESDPDALKVPFFHQNIDYDEVLFYHAGDFFSRDNFHAGLISFHPAGFPHGPHPKALAGANSGKKTFLDEVAVMVDSWQPLQIDDNALGVERADYWKSWMTK